MNRCRLLYLSQYHEGRLSQNLCLDDLRSKIRFKEAQVQRDLVLSICNIRERLFGLILIQAALLAQRTPIKPDWTELKCPCLINATLSDGPWREEEQPMQT